MFNTTFWTIMEITLPKDEAGKKELSWGDKYCHAERIYVMLNSIQHLLYRGDPESSSG